jgi:hypothetical protein
VSVASFAPIILVGPIADLVGNVAVLFIVAAAVFLCGVVSVLRRGRLRPVERRQTSKGPSRPAGLDPVAAVVAAELEVGPRRTSRSASAAASSEAARSEAAAPSTVGAAEPGSMPAAPTPAPAATATGAAGDDVPDTSSDRT